MLQTTSFRLVVTLLLSGAAMFAQTGAPPAPAVSGPIGQPAEAPVETAEATETLGPAAVPPPAAISSAPIESSTELSRSNYLRGSLSVGSSYDDNVFNSAGKQQGGFTYSVLPGIGLDVTRTRVRWRTDYSTGLTIAERLTPRNQNAQNLGTDLSILLSPHVRLHLNDHFSITSGYANGGTPGIPGGNVLQQPNQFTVTPLSKTLTNAGAVGISYQFSATSMVGADANGNITRYTNEAPGNTTGLVDSNTYGASGFYTRRISSRNWVGVRYGYQHLTTEDSLQTTDDHTILLFDTIYLTPTMQLSFFGGPDYTSSDSIQVVQGVKIPISNQRWSGAGGVSYSWQGKRTGIGADFSRRVNDGGGLQASVIQTFVSGRVSQQIVKSFTIGLGGSYNTSDSLTQATTPTDTTDTASGSLTLSKTIRQNLLISGGYTREHQRQTGTGITDIPADHNRGWVMISYSFTRPLGR